MRNIFWMLLLAAAAPACSKKNNGTPPALTGAWTLARGFDPATAIEWYYRPDTAQAIDYSFTFYVNGHYLAIWAGLPYDSGTYTYAGAKLKLASVVNSFPELDSVQLKGDTLYRFTGRSIWGQGFVVYSRIPGSF